MDYEYRIEIDCKIQRNSFQDLRSKGYTLRIICKIVKGFSDALYRGYTLPEKSFQQLEGIFGNPIKHKIRTKNNNIDPSTIIKDSKLAELIRIILGDCTVGHYIDKYHKNNYLLEITLDGMMKWKMFYM